MCCNESFFCSSFDFTPKRRIVLTSPGKESIALVWRTLEGRLEDCFTVAIVRVSYRLAVLIPSSSARCLLRW